MSGSHFSSLNCNCSSDGTHTQHVCLFFLFAGEVGSGSTAVAVAAAQAAIATLPMQPGRRGSGALKAPYVAALGMFLFTAVVGLTCRCLVEPPKLKQNSWLWQKAFKVPLYLK